MQNSHCSELFVFIAIMAAPATPAAWGAGPAARRGDKLGERKTFSNDAPIHHMGD